MNQPTTLREIINQGATVARWLLTLLPLSAAIGGAGAFFLWSLDWVTRTRQEHAWLLFLLPVAGILSAWVYGWRGKNCDGGNNLLIDEIHKPGYGIPRRMAPLVLGGTLLTHLCGGSAGREGTAVQMGGALASALGRVIKPDTQTWRILLMCGIAGGFGAVFGTPVSGAIFAMEVLTIGRVTYDALLPCLFCAVLSDRFCMAFGAHHTHYPHDSITGADEWLPYLLICVKVTVAGAIFGLAGRLFAWGAHGVKSLGTRVFKSPILRIAAGGAMVVLLAQIPGATSYLGLGVTNPDVNAVSIVTCFRDGGAGPLSWLWKMTYTCVTVGSGYKGGEVTPLFFIGAALGNTLAGLLSAPVEVFAALGFISVFAGAANTPVACTVLGMELFGAQNGALFALACFTAYAFSGHRGIYHAQLLGTPKGPP